VLAVTSGHRLGGRRVDAWAAGVPPEGWLRLSAGEGAKGPRLHDWAFLPYRGGAPAGRAKGLARPSHRSITVAIRPKILMSNPVPSPWPKAGGGRRDRGPEGQPIST